MSYTEYLDMFFETQKKECPYRAFTFDIVNSRKQPQYLQENELHHQFLEYVYSLLVEEENKTNKQILLSDKFNISYYSLPSTKNGNETNPMVLGDMITFFVYNGSISTKRMLELFSIGLKKFNILYPFHFQTGVYETNDYGEGGIKMYKGYMPAILEKLSKDSPNTISQTTNIGEFEIK